LVTPVDNNQVLLTGENSFLRLVQNEGGEYSSRASFWRVSVSPAGPGHTLFLESELTGEQPRVYADNLALARWLQQEIETVIHEPNSDLSLPVIEASFGRIGDASTFWTENILTASGDVTLTWFDFMEPFIIRPTGNNESGSLSVYSLFIPARQARITINGEQASGRPNPEDVDGQPSSSASLALSETWLRVR
jgi:hypothetical protein